MKAERGAFGPISAESARSEDYKTLMGRDLIRPTRRDERPESRMKPKKRAEACARMANFRTPGQLKINGGREPVGERVGLLETYGVLGGAMPFFQNIFQGARDALTGPEVTEPQSESFTAFNEENLPAADAVAPPKRGRPPGSTASSVFETV